MYAFASAELPDRAWPNRTITKAPRWLSTDLSLPGRMSEERRLRLFELLVRMGYTEIEIGSPASRQADFDFIRRLLDEGKVPDDVWICARAGPANEQLDRTMRALRGVRNAMVNLQDLGLPPESDLATRRRLAVNSTERIMELADTLPADDHLSIEYSGEPGAGLEIWEAVIDLWGPDREIVLTVPRTESTPNVYADRVEWIGARLPRCSDVCLSVRPDDARGTAVAEAELAVMAGAERVAGRLFGRGRACLVTLGLNLYSQGIDPRIDFSDIDEIRRVAERCTGARVHERHPYAGDLVYTSFAGSHQDAIKKGFEAMDREAAKAGVPAREIRWSVPYLPIDPKDVGRSYEAVIRVNSQSGKGGVAYIMKSEHGLDLPRRMQLEFSHIVQAHTDGGGEVTAEQMWKIFEAEYLVDDSLGPFVDVPVAGRDATLSVPGMDMRLLDRFEHTIPAAPQERPVSGPPARDTLAQPPAHVGRVRLVCYVECLIEGQVTWGAGIDSDAEAAARKALRSAVMRRTVSPEPVGANSCCPAQRGLSL